MIRFWLGRDRIRVEFDGLCAIGIYRDDSLTFEVSGPVGEVPDRVAHLCLDAMRRDEMLPGYQGDETKAQMNAAWFAFGESEAA